MGVPGEAGEEAAVFLEYVYPALFPTVFAPVADVDVALRVNRDAVWIFLLAAVGSVAAELGDEVAVSGELLHPMVLEVSHVYEALVVHGDAPG